MFVVSIISCVELAVTQSRAEINENVQDVHVEYLNSYVCAQLYGAKVHVERLIVYAPLPMV